jgi:hypothetical protein
VPDGRLFLRGITPHQDSLCAIQAPSGGELNSPAPQLDLAVPDHSILSQQAKRVTLPRRFPSTGYL